MDNYNDLVAQLEWFVKEKARLEDASASVRAVRSEVEDISFTLANDTTLGDVQRAQGEARSAILYYDAVSLEAGEGLLDALAAAIAATGRAYLTNEAANTEHAEHMVQMIEQVGL